MATIVWPKAGQTRHKPLGTGRLPSPPSHLEPPERKLFEENVRDYAIDDAHSVDLLVIAMEARCRCRRAREQLAKDGEVIKDRFGQLVAHPSIAIERDSRDAYLRAMRALNLKPSAKD
jgi:phage terminase small subunit